MIESNKGFFTPKNPHKYVGARPIVWRSTLERNFCRMCDLNPNIISWGSESTVIRYIKPTDNKPHRYFVDFTLTLLEEKTGKKIKYLVEVKPSKKLLQPTETKRKKRSTLLFEQTEYSVNMAKFHAARQYCAERNMRFQILTELHLQNLSVAFGG